MNSVRYQFIIISLVAALLMGFGMPKAKAVVN